MPTPLLVGNDVVDLGSSQTRAKERNARFIERVFSPTERAILGNSPHPNLTLWCLWAAKEAAYKIVKKRYPDTLFSHKKFVVSGALTSFQSKQLSGWVTHEHTHVTVCWQINKAYVHCVGVWPHAAFDALACAVRPNDDATLSSVVLSPRELRSARSRESRSVRQLAKQLLARRGLDGVEIVRPHVEGHLLAPRLWRGDQRLLQSDVSLSHHGRFVAAAIVVIADMTLLQSPPPSA